MWHWSCLGPITPADQGLAAEDHDDDVDYQRDDDDDDDDVYGYGDDDYYDRVLFLMFTG